MTCPFVACWCRHVTAPHFRKFVPLIENKQNFMAVASGSTVKSKKSLRKDAYEQPDFYAIDELLTEEHKLIRTSIRDFVKKEITPFIEDWAQRAHFPYEIVKKFGEIGAFGPTVPQQYGGGGLDYI